MIEPPLDLLHGADPGILQGPYNVDARDYDNRMTIFDNLLIGQLMDAGGRNENAELTVSQSRYLPRKSLTHEAYQEFLVFRHILR